MPMTVELIDEGGDALGRVEDRLNSVVVGGTQAAELKIRLAHYIDPYGKTEFNRSQMEDLLSDLERLHAERTLPERREVLGQTMNLARRCQEGTRLYLLFSGD